MSSVHSPWGYNWPTAEEAQKQQQQMALQQQQQQQQQQLANLPAALLSTLKREKKPFTYTPGGVNLSEVLEARLQKRMERKKRYYSGSQEEEQRPTPPRQVVVMPTYNTALDLYSTQNALEVLEMQAGLSGGDRSTSSPPRSATLPRNHTFRFEDSAPERGVAQSKAFRVLQIMTDTEEDASARCGGQCRRHEETRFRGLRESGHIPSRFFHTLQKITGTDTDDDGQQRRTADHTTTDDDGVVVVEASFPAPSVPPTASGYLRRPAAFLPSKASPAPGFRPVRPPLGHRAAVSGTDF